MAIFHISAKAVARSKGRSATAAAAYRAGERIKDERTGEVHDYTKKQGVLYSEIVTPDGIAVSREVLWNLAEAAEKRKDGTPAKEYEIALPDGVSAEERKRIAIDFAKAIVKQEKCAVDVCIHEPSKKGDTRNHHAHLLCTTREVMPTGTLGEKCAINKSDRDRQKMGLSSGKTALVKLREMLAGIINMALERSGVSERVDHRTLSEQGIDRDANKHKGPTAVNMERRGKITERAAIGREVHGTSREAEAKAVAEELAKLKREEAAEVRAVAEEGAAIERDALVPGAGSPPPTVAEELAKPEREEVAESREVIEPEPGNVIEERDPETPAPRHEAAAMTIAEITALLAEHKREVAAAFAAERAEAEAKADKKGAAIGGREESAKPEREETAEAKEAKEAARREVAKERMAERRDAARERVEARRAARAAEAAASEREAQQREQQQRVAEQKAREERSNAHYRASGTRSKL